MRDARFDSLGDRMKQYEMREAGRKLMPGLPVLVRLDGRAFHTFTSDLPRPYHEPLSRAMIETAKYLVAETQATIGYTQSDEITLVFVNQRTDATFIFDGRMQKLCSVLAGMATAKFNQEVGLRMPDKARLLPVFDARVWQVPNLAEAANCLVWRSSDAEKNSITMAASAYYPHQDLHKKSSQEKHDMLHAVGINWNDYPAFFKRGVFVRRETVLKPLSNGELQKIPEQYRPSGPVPRNVVMELEMPPVNRIANLVEALLFGEPPVLKAETEETTQP